MKKFLSFMFVFMAMLMIVSPVLADTATGLDNSYPVSPIQNIGDVFNLLSKATSWIFVALLFMAFIFIIMGAFTYITSKGDPKLITNAKNYIIYALIGVAIGILAKGLILAVCSILGVTCTFFF